VFREDKVKKKSYKKRDDEVIRGGDKAYLGHNGWFGIALSYGLLQKEKSKKREVREGIENLSFFFFFLFLRKKRDEKKK